MFFQRSRMGLRLKFNLVLVLVILAASAAAGLVSDRVSPGGFDVPGYSDSGRDVIAVLGSSFNRMRRSLGKISMQMIERGN